MYIGETERSFEEPITDHNKRDKKSHIYKHIGGNSHPQVWLDNFQIVGGNYGNHIKRKSGWSIVNKLIKTIPEQAR